MRLTQRQIEYIERIGIGKRNKKDLGIGCHWDHHYKTKRNAVNRLIALGLVQSQDKMEMEESGHRVLNGKIKTWYFLTKKGRVEHLKRIMIEKLSESYKEITGHQPEKAVVDSILKSELKLIEEATQ